MQVTAQNKIIVALCNCCLCYQITFLIQQMVPCNTFSETVFTTSPKQLFHSLILLEIRLDPTA